MPTAKKAYSFTLNNYTVSEYDSLLSNLRSEVSYAIVGKEIGASGTPHLQGYALFRKSYHFNTIKSRYLPRCHIEVSAGTADDNRRYCSKDGDFIEIGDKPTVKRSRDELAKSFAERLESGNDGLLQFASEQPGTYYFSGHNLLRNYQSLQRPRDRPDISVQWYYGPPGSGKSRKAHETLPSAYVKEPRTKWWNGYMFEKEIIIDDFGPGGIDINHLLRWFDRYKCLVESKGGMIPLYGETFIVTSNFMPCDLFQSKSIVNEGNTWNNVICEHPQIPALMRRIQIINF